MNRSSQLKSVASTLVLVTLTGCLYPHTSPRSPEIYGRILDARTHASVQGAKVFLTEHPKVSRASDAEGHFRLKKTHNFHLLVGPGCSSGGGWPAGDYWGCAITVSHTNYETYVQRGSDDRWLNDKGDILLQPRQ